MSTKSAFVSLVVIAVVIGISAAAFCGANPNCKIAIHMKAHPTSCTKNYPTFTTCSQILTTTALCEFDVMPVFYELNEYTLVEFGITWPLEWGEDSWVRCKGTIAIGGIMGPNSGTAISWSTCQRSWSIAPGYLWMLATGPGVFSIVANPATGDCGVADCADSPGPYYDHAVATFSGGCCGSIGENPCTTTDVKPSTWGQIKSQFK